MKKTADAHAVIDMLVPPGGGPGPHAHKNIQENGLSRLVLFGKKRQQKVLVFQ